MSNDKTPISGNIAFGCQTGPSGKYYPLIKINVDGAGECNFICPDISADTSEGLEEVMHLFYNVLLKCRHGGHKVFPGGQDR